jgi:hypothetical protein
VAHSKVGGPVYKLVTQVQWDKTKNVLALITALLFAHGSQVRRAGVWLPRAPLESAQGFLIYVSRTYTSMIPFLKGLHLTIDSWRTNPDDDGWRRTGHFEPKIKDGVVEALNAPPLVQAVPWLGNDLHALGELMASAEPPHVLVLPIATAAAGFMFGDASRMGFGQSLWFRIRWALG